MTLCNEPAHPTVNAMSSIFVLLTVVFMLLEVPQLPEKLRQMMSRRRKAWRQFNARLIAFSHYLVLKAAIGIVTGLVAWGMLAALDVRFAFVWGLLAFALNYILILDRCSLPAARIQVLVFNGFYDALLVLAGYLLINPGLRQYP